MSLHPFEITMISVESGPDLRWVGLAKSPEDAVDDFLEDYDVHYTLVRKAPDHEMYVAEDGDEVVGSITVMPLVPGRFE